MRKLLMSVMMAFIIVPSISADEFIGAIFNPKEKPVKKVKVWRKNTTESVITGKDGEFLFRDLTPSDTLVVSVNKKYEAVIPVGNLKNVTIKLDKKEFYVHDGSNETRCDYAMVKRAENNSNVLTHAQIQEMNAESIYDLLRSRIPGVTVNYGEDGQYVSIRGGNSLELNTEPIFVVDGVIYEHSADVDGAISVSDINRLEVSKDGNAYGVKGANGAIIITTLKSK